MLPGSSFFYDAFWELHTCRLTDFGPIPWTAIDQFGDRYATDDEQAEALVYVIRGLDNWYIARAIAKMESKPTKGGKSKPKSKVTPKK